MTSPCTRIASFRFATAKWRAINRPAALNSCSITFLEPQTAGARPHQRARLMGAEVLFCAVVMSKLFCTLLVAVCLSAQVDITRFRRIDDNVYCGHQPPPQGYAQLKQMGIKTVLDLRGGIIHKPHEEEEVRAASMQ